MELKNPLTNQTVEDAMKQLKNDRDPREQLFKFNERVAVYFAVDPDEVFMTTKSLIRAKHTSSHLTKAIMVGKAIR
ncbi:hypothetical protein BsIDN1_59350 [Bacillus safensis]|uniref:Restriction endonuclease type I HsdR N-terminal domain-containing protein n=1 Tax=Bacillus safensis TaxID=561879 RepID=A0A5S9MFQ9_BACIA|nr:hypothetical protein BsIDN1_59350 [Bacillus safensis]